MVPRPRSGLGLNELLGLKCPDQEPSYHAERHNIDWQQNADGKGVVPGWISELPCPVGEGNSQYLSDHVGVGWALAPAKKSFVLKPFWPLICNEPMQAVVAIPVDQKRGNNDQNGNCEKTCHRALTPELSRAAKRRRLE